jgi:hypothetical protein
VRDEGGGSTLDSILREAASTTYQSRPSGFSSERFELIRELGCGGFGVVYEAVDRELHGSPTVALKLLRGAHADRLYRFKREFRSLAEVRHKNLVQLYELVATGPDVFFTMELIRGESPLKYGRNNPDQARHLMAELAEGLMALHHAGKLHRDIKPSNILVEPDGRVVLLDFGLAIEIDVGHSAERAGTPRYMSPEQCAEQPLEEASDWYSAGTVLFETLTKRTPFVGTVEELLLAKGSREAPRASTFADVPEDLDDLCAALLSRDPAARPTGDEVLRRLRSKTPPSKVAPPRYDPFVGRAREKDLLLRLFDEGGHKVVLARGPSGIGKSALLRWFLDEVGRRQPAALVFAGRCFEMESVPYKALDAVVDELARHLKGLPEVDAAVLLPRDANALATLFPVLRQVPAFAPKSVRRPDDAGEVRTRGVSALREILTRISDRRPVVVCIDDLQWGDVDSAALLGELIRLPDAPAVFWLMSFREEEANTSPLLARLSQLRATTLSDVPIVDLQLTGLDRVEAEELAATLLGPGDDRARARTIAEESQGNPFFVRELTRTDGGDHALGSLVRDRVSQLEGSARRVLEAVAVAARPLELDIVAASTETSGELRDALSRLRAERLIRARDAHNERLIECYHDRIRQAVVESIAPDRLSVIHLQLAAALEAHGVSDAAQIGRHLAEGGDRVRALGYLTRAAEQAAAAMAFEEAAQLYRRALELGHATVAVELAYAEALSAAGHGREAARLWLALADRVGEEQRIDLLRRATEELLLCGEVEQGFATMNTLLAMLDLSVPRSTTGAIARIVGTRIAETIFGRRLRRRSEPASARELQRVDTIGSLAFSVVQLDPVIRYALQRQHLRLALRSGDRQRAAYALWLEAPIIAVKGSRGAAATRRTLQAARDMAAGIDESHMPAAVFRIAEGIVAFLEGRWLEGLQHLQAAEQAPNTSVIGHSSLRGSIYIWRAMNLFWMGRSGDLLAALPSQLRDMEEHGNLYATLWLKLFEGWALSCSGRLEAARKVSESVRARLPPGVFRLHHRHLAHSQLQYLLLDGKAEKAWQLMQTGGTRRFAMLGQSQRVAGLWTRANVALGRAVATPAARDAMVAESRKLAHKMERERVPWVDAIARTVRASSALVAGHSDEAVQLLGEAETLLEAHHLESVLAVVRLQRGKMIGGDAGRKTLELAQTWMTAQRVHPSVARIFLAASET